MKLFNSNRTNPMNNMTDEEAKEFNLGCAEYLGYHDCYIDSVGEFRCKHVNTEFSFNPAHDSNDLDPVIEKMKLDIMFDQSYDYWEVSNEAIANPVMWTETDKDRNTAIIKCIQQVLRGKV